MQGGEGLHKLNRRESRIHICNGYENVVDIGLILEYVWKSIHGRCQIYVYIYEKKITNQNGIVNR